MEKDIVIVLPFISQERRYGEKWNEDDFQTSKNKMWEKDTWISIWNEWK